MALDVSCPLLLNIDNKPWYTINDTDSQRYAAAVQILAAVLTYSFEVE